MIKTIKMKNKKGQFYVLTAVIICSVLFMLLYGREPMQKINTEFRSLYNNYIYESPIVINNAIYHNKNLSNQFKNFTASFIRYAKEKNINLGVFYMLKVDDDIEAANYLNDEINISTINEILMSNNHIRFKIENYNNMTIYFKNVTYLYNITEDKVQFKVLFIKQ